MCPVDMYTHLSHTPHCTDMPCTPTCDFTQKAHPARVYGRSRAGPPRTARAPPPTASACMRSAPGAEATEPPPPSRCRSLDGQRGLALVAAELLRDAADEVDERPIDGDVGELLAPPPRARP